MLASCFAPDSVERARNGKPMILIPQSLSYRLSLARLIETFGRVVPVHNIPPGLDIVRPLVLVLQIIGVFPDIDAQDGCLPIAYRTVLIGGAQHLQLALIDN